MTLGKRGSRWKEEGLGIGVLQNVFKLYPCTCMTEGGGVGEVAAAG